MHSRVFNIVPKVAAYEKIDENDAFEMMENRVEDKLTRFDKNLNDRYGYLFLFELNLPFTELEWFYYMLTKYAPDAVVEFVVLQVYDYHF